MSPARSRLSAARVTTWLLVIGVAGLAVATATALLADGWWRAELLTNLTVQFTITAGLVVVLAGALRRWWIAALAVLVLGVNLNSVVPGLADTQFGQAARPLATADTLDVTFFNTKLVGADRQRTIAELARRDDDVIVLAGGYSAWTEALEADTSLDLNLRFAPEDDDEDLEMIVLTRDPDAQVTVHRPTDERRDWLLEIVVDLDGRPAHVLAAHPVSPMTRQRAARRDATLRWIAGWARDQDGPAIVLGDLNVTPWSPRFDELLDQGGLVDSQVGHGRQPSYPAVLGPLGLPIDHILHSRDLTTLVRGRGPSFGSDHRMVHATLTRRAESPDPASGAGTGSGTGSGSGLSGQSSSAPENFSVVAWP